MELAGSQAKAAVRVAAPRVLPGTPSWGRVLATTISLWTGRRVARLRHPRMALFLTICLVVAAAAVVSVVQFAGTSPRTASPPRTATPSRPHQVRPAWAAGAAGAVRGQAAAWVAGQVSSAEMVACDPLMCTALRAHGVAAGRLVPVGTGTSGATGGVLVASMVYDGQQSAPVLLASFGSGGNVVEVRAAAPGGLAAYQRAVQADQAARRSAGTQLLHSRRIQVGGQAAGQLAAGEVDTRLLIMLAMLASQHRWQVVAFGGASPGVPLAQAPFRQVTITGPDAGAVASSLALVRAQRAPYQAAQSAIVRLPGGQAAQGQLALRIDFAAPSPPGLLTGGASG
jgi:hypothetical protein